MTEPSDDTLREWLLHRLPPEQTEALEQRLLQDDAFGEHLREVEVDLLDDYARGRLGDADRLAVAAHLAGMPRDRERLRIAKALAQLSSQSGASAGAPPADAAFAAPAHAKPIARRSLRGRRSLAAATLLALAAGLVIAIGLNRRAAIDRLPTETGTTSTITLMASQQRGESVQTIRIAHDASTIRLQAEVMPAAATARYAVSIGEGQRRVFDAADLATRQTGQYTFVEVSFPADVFAAGQQDVRIHAVTPGVPEQSWSVHIWRE